jgi:hypothetical protein
MFGRTRSARSLLAGLAGLLGLLALSGCISVTHHDDDEGYYRCYGGRCYYHDD